MFQQPDHKNPRVISNSADQPQKDPIIDATDIVRKRDAVPPEPLGSAEPSSDKPTLVDRVEEESLESFPASDAPSH